MHEHTDQSASRNSSSTRGVQPAALALPFAGGWEVHQHRHCIWIVSVDNCPHQQPIEELAQALEQAFQELGGSAPVTRDPSEWDGRAPIVVGAHLLARLGSPVLPPGSILYNLEQVALEGASLDAAYLELLGQHPVLGCSRRNREALRRAGVKHAGLLEIGYSPKPTRVSVDGEHDVDIVIWGGSTDRASAVSTRLSENGRNKVVVLTKMPATEGDPTIARAKIVLKLQDEKPGLADISALAYFLANRVCLVCEASASDADFKPYSGGLELVAPDEVVDRCLELLVDPARREALAQTGLERIARRRQSRLLQNSILDGATAVAEASDRLSQATSRLATNRAYRDERISADGMRFVNCTFSGTTLVYEGGEVPVFQNCNMSGVSFDFGGAAGNTFQFLKMLLNQKIISGL